MKTARGKVLLYVLLALFGIYLCMQAKDCTRNLSTKWYPKKIDKGYGYGTSEKVITVPEKEKIIKQLKEDL